ncbi:hypothetical protein PENANT_c184G06558 [Penicillium antarcticum]|uniref:Uncharacterized protein n=1 Tax=Penicillium antarcticum TaxID=416450 RepID=A0A1V6PB12_9EURO|nr:hypothetical protein PENANT_c184G06558 [Penicillium antarcticum]
MNGSAFNPLRPISPTLTLSRIAWNTNLPNSSTRSPLSTRPVTRPSPMTRRNWTRRDPNTANWWF